MRGSSYPSTRTLHENGHRGVRLLAQGLVVLALFCSVVGCGGDDADTHWQRIKQRGALRVGMDPNWVPFEYVDGTGQLSGFDVDLALALAERMGLDVHFDASLSYDGLYDALVAGRVDVVISAVLVDAAHGSDFAFSRPYFDAGQVIVVDQRRTDLAEMADLSGSVLAVELGSAGDSVGRRWARRLVDLTLLHVDSPDLALTAVADGGADAALVDRATALIELKRRGANSPSAHQGSAGSSQLGIVGQPVTDEQYAIVVPQSSTRLLTAINDALTGLENEGSLARLEREWLGP